MKFRVEVVCVNDEGAEERREVTEIERQQLAMETLGLSLTEGKTLLQGVQGFVAARCRGRVVIHTDMYTCQIYTAYRPTCGILRDNRQLGDQTCANRSLPKRAGL